MLNMIQINLFITVNVLLQKFIMNKILDIIYMITYVVINKFPLVD